MIRWLIRIAFIALLIFEAANYYRVLHFTVDYTWFGLLITSLAVFLFLEIGNRILKTRLHASLHWTAWPLSFGMVACDAFGDMLHLYGQLDWYDRVIHLLGGAAATVIIYSIFTSVARAHEWRHPHHLSLLFSLGLATTFGVLYEIEEYLEDWANLTNRLGDGPDTANDLLMNLLGSLAVVFIIGITRYARKRRIR